MTVFHDPDQIAERLRLVCPLAEAILVGWRRTSVHLFIQDEAFTNFILRTAREANPEIAIIGEAYYGQTAESYESVATYNIPANASAVLLFNLGYNHIAIETAMDIVFPKVKDLPRIGVVVGSGPYYESECLTRRKFEDNLKIKQELERRFLAGGCIGTITFRTDGSECGFSDNLATKYKEETP